MEIFKEFRFEAAHQLPWLPEGHKCRRMHGHSYRMRICIEGPIDPATSWVMDFADISKVVKPVIEELDHQCLNEIDGLSRPTTEEIARWIWRRLKPSLPRLARVELWETPTSGCIYRGEHEEPGAG